MHPVLVSLGPITIDSYYAVWGIALCAAVFWIRSRCVRIYGISYDDASDVLIWSIFGVMIGAMLGGYLDNWERYARDPMTMLRFWESGMSSGPGFIGGGLAGIFKLRRMGLKVGAFADAASVPCAFMLALGRWGCLMSGCCRGIAFAPPLAISYPDSPDVFVYPSQISESIAAFAIGVALVFIERRTRGRTGVLWPLFLISYGAYRLVFDFLRAGDRILGLRVGQYTGAAAIGVGLVWIAWSLRRSRVE